MAHTGCIRLYCCRLAMPQLAGVVKVHELSIVADMVCAGDGRWATVKWILCVQIRVVIPRVAEAGAAIRHKFCVAVH